MPSIHAVTAVVISFAQAFERARTARRTPLCPLSPWCPSCPSCSYEETPRQQTVLQPDRPPARPLRRRRTPPRLERARVVGTVDIEKQNSIGIDLRRERLRLPL